LSWIDSAKRLAAESAAAHVESGMVVGLGSGSTAAYAICSIGERLSSGALNDVLGVPTSHQAEMDAVEAGIPMTSLYEHPELDLGIDGADQISGGLDAIKGGGGALLREKVVASVSRLYILVADERKLTDRLGAGQPLPLEILPFALGSALRGIEDLGSKAVVRKGGSKLGPVVTDNGNFIVDADFGAIPDPGVLDAELKAVPGVLETGLFLGYAHFAYVGTESGVRKLSH
jgi:ribose 5-phosphate isomerase A